MQSTSTLSAQLFFLEFLEFSLVRIFRHSSLAFVLIMHPVFFNVVAGPAFPGFFKSRAIVKVSDFGNMQWRIKILVNMAALTVLANYFIGLPRAEVTLERHLNFLSAASCECYEQQDYQEALLCKTRHPHGKGFWVCKFLKCIHRNQTRRHCQNIQFVVALSRLETDFSVVFHNFSGIAMVRNITFPQKPAQPRRPLIISLQGQGQIPKTGHHLVQVVSP